LQVSGIDKADHVCGNLLVGSVRIFLYVADVEFI
jgi:hypothetical protein